MPALLLLLTLMGGSSSLMAAQWLPTDSAQLEKVFIIARHGVRAPIHLTPEVRELAAQPFPFWPVPAGHLTAKGFSQMQWLGRKLHHQFVDAGLLQLEGCGDANQVFVWTDVNARTRHSGEAFLMGLAPGCEEPIHHQKDLSKPDPRFNPIKAGLCKVSAPKARQAIESVVGHPLDAIDTLEEASIHKVEQVLNISQSEACKGIEKGDCHLAQLQPTQLVFGENNEPQFTGAVQTASSLAEDFILEKMQGINAGWGRISGLKQWDLLMEVHNKHLEWLYHAPYLSVRHAAPIIEIIANEFADQPMRGLTETHKAQPKVVVMMGHDTNLASVSGALDMVWKLKDEPDQTPVGTALIFERWRLPDDRTQMVSYLLYPPLDNLSTLKRLELTIPNCSGKHGCDQQAMVKMLRNVLANAAKCRLHGPAFRLER